jgi:hypothetical protein
MINSNLKDRARGARGVGEGTAARTRPARYHALRAACAALSIAALTALTSCIGVRADITLKADNSGTLALEYRVSKLVESLGKQDGNERWLPVPVGRADFERTLARLPGMSLLEFSTTEDARDIVVAARLAFTDMDTLLGFLDASGGGAVFAQAGTARTLTLALSGGRGAAGPELDALVATAAAGYTVSIAATFPTTAALTAPTLDGARIEPTGRTVSCAYPLAAILSAREAVEIEFRW